MSRRKQLRPFKVQDDDDDDNDNNAKPAKKNADNGISTSSNGDNADATHNTSQTYKDSEAKDIHGNSERSTEKSVNKSIEVDVKLPNNQSAALGIHEKYQNSANKNERARCVQSHIVNENPSDLDKNDSFIQGESSKNGSYENAAVKDSSSKSDYHEDEEDFINKDSPENDTEMVTHENATLEALENTKVAVAQFAAAALSKGSDETSTKDLTMLQSALFTLQHQQVFQMQLIEQLQFQLAKNSTRRDKKRSKCSQTKAKKDEPESQGQTAAIAEDELIQRSNECSRLSTNDELKNTLNEENNQKTREEQSNIIQKSNLKPVDCNISSSLASNIITNHDSNLPSNETNSLQLLQKRAEEVLDSASQSFTTGSLIDELSYRTGAFFNDGPTDDPALKHRCRFCGKIFGSDSALQIHLRSHTGERPFECKVCRSRFTTKGNLKVHYQRHTETGEFTSESKNDLLRPPIDFRTHVQPAKLISDKSPFEDTLDLSQKEKEIEKEENCSKKIETEIRDRSLTPDTPRRFDNESTRSYLSFDQEYSSAKKKAWEKYMDIVDTPKATELQQDEAYRVDPNKCPICNRLLSCRSALRQHYRTHTGERPFRCRLCARSFTTKGNLKTHIGVHKINPLLSPVHACTMCPKKYSTAHALQQHINTHTGAPIEMTIDQIRATEVRDFVSRDSLNDLYGSNSSLGDFNETSTRDSSVDFNEFSNRDGAQQKNVASESRNRAPIVDLLDSEDSKTERTKRDFEKEIENLNKDSRFSGSPEPKRKCNESLADKIQKDDPSKMDFFSKFPAMFGSAAVPLSSPSSILGGNLNSFFGSNSFNPVGFATGIRGNTTCNICFKTLACHSALEIHYRSHTKEKPYLCQLCNRGFSTKGNMKQHMLTHKIRDMPQHMFRNSTQSPSSDSNNSLSVSGFQTQSQSQPAEMTTNDDTLNADRQLKISQEKDNDFEMNRNDATTATATGAAVTSVDQSIPTYLSSDDSGSMSSPIQAKNGVNDLTEIRSGDEEITSNNTFALSAAHILRQQSNTPTKNDVHSTKSNNETSQKIKTKDSKRDYCKLCNKHFGSSSALETHIRSHTGDKPFICAICEKGFSTKGNLKVHMGTHSWTNEPNRSRLSLDITNHFPQMNPYGLHRPADLFNPFIANAAAIQQKLHEANLYQKYVNAANIRNFSTDILKNNDEQSLQRNLFGLAHLPFQVFNEHVEQGSMKNK